MKVVWQIGWAFLFGGIFAVAAALFRMFVSPMVPASLLDPATLALVGLLGAVLYATGIHQRFEKIAGAGAFIPLNGFSAAVAAVFEQTRRSGGSSVQALWQGFLLLVKVILSGTAVVMVTAVVVWLMG